MKKILPLYMKKIGDNEFLISNVLGYFLILNECDIQNIATEKDRQDLDKTYEIKFDDKILLKKLIDNYFIVDDENISEYSNIYRARNCGLFHSTGLHIFVLTLDCNLKCMYCQAAYDIDYCFMTKETARKAIDILLSSLSKTKNGVL